MTRCSPTYILLFISLIFLWVNTEVLKASTEGEKAPAKADAPAAPQPESYVVSNGDKLSYRVAEDKEDAKLLTVSPAGEIEVPYLGRVLVAGKSISDIQHTIKALLEKELYNQATVFVSVEETAIRQQPATKAKSVYVVGAVRLQGVQEMPAGDKYMLSHAILKANGFSSFANKRKVLIQRKTADGKREELTVDAASVLEDGKLENDVELKAGDMVIIKEKLINF